MHHFFFDHENSLPSVFYELLVDIASARELHQHTLPHPRLPSISLALLSLPKPLRGQRLPFSVSHSHSHPHPHPHSHSHSHSPSHSLSFCVSFPLSQCLPPSRSFAHSPLNCPPTADRRPPPITHLSSQLLLPRCPRSSHRRLAPAACPSQRRAARAQEKMYLYSACVTPSDCCITCCRRVRPPAIGVGGVHSPCLRPLPVHGR